MTTEKKEELISYLKRLKSHDEEAAKEELRRVEEIAEAVRLMKRSQETNRRRIAPLFRRRNYIVVR